MTAPDKIKQLVETFEQNIHEYQSRKNETELRRQFLDPFFTALGWDVDNKKGAEERGKEVAHEHSVEIDGQQKKADYAFRADGGDFDFLVEAKKPSVKVESNLDAAFQIRRYGWSARLPINILTDFEHFAIYDCRARPNYSKDTATTGRIQLIHYSEYVEKWDEITALFSPAAIRNGALNKFKDELKTKKGTQEVDDAFLEEIEAWREALARNIATRNKHLDLNEEQVNFAVQMTIDRIIFLRIAEERGMEKDRRLFELALTPDPSPSGRGESVYQNLLKLFAQADGRYNSGLFHFPAGRSAKKDKDRENPDALTPTLTIDDKVLKDVIRDLYYPSPYAFNYIPAEILGSVYERFLGKVIRLTAGGNAKVEDKPEVRKAGGVYYTPAYIVEYIVRNTVGGMVNGKLVNGNWVGGMTPAEVSEIKIVDPACGSGSFLLGAYQFLLDWHLDWYVANNPEKHVKNKILLTADNKTYRLSLDEKKRILLNNIHGVDLDPQAVEVTKLSLLLKVVEDPGQLKMFEEDHILPNLNKNIKNGNALIGMDYFSGQMFGDMDEMKRVKPFEWQDEFPQVFRRGGGKGKTSEVSQTSEVSSAGGGFDVVIGNPPYIPIETMSDSEKAYYSRNSELERKFDSSVVFILEGLKKLNKNGILGFISSITWQTGENYGKLRRTLFEKYGVTQLVNLPFDVFKDAYVDTGLYFIGGSPTDHYSIFRFSKKEKNPDLSKMDFVDVPVNMIAPPDYKIILDPETQRISAKLLANPNFIQLGEFTISTQGLSGSRFTGYEKPEKNCLSFLEKGNVYRYAMITETVSYVDMADKPSLIPFYQAGNRLLIRRVINRQDRLMATFCDFELVTKKDINPFIVISPEWNPLFVLGIINSKLISYIYVNSSSIATKDDFRQTTLAELRKLPIPKYQSENKNHDKMVKLVEQMLALHKSHAVANPQDGELLQRQIKSTDRQIDELVYQLYGLSAEEIGIVEGE